MGSLSNAQKTVQVTNRWYKVICEPVPSGLTPQELESGAWGWALIIIRGFPPQLGIQSKQWRSPQGRQLLSCRGFPRGQAGLLGGSRNPAADLGVHFGETEVRGMLVFPRARRLARKTVVPRTRWINVIIIGLLLYMIDISARRRYSPGIWM